ncbi:hypothetical protein C8R46DRAFT_897370, partial [Mycena filopes]
MLAILYVLSTVPAHKSLRIYTDSQYCIRTSVYWAISHSDRGWKCANADLLQDIVSWIRFRSAKVHFVDVKAHSGNPHNDGADAAAKAGAQLPLPAGGYIRWPAPWPPLRLGEPLCSMKVSCDIPEMPVAPKREENIEGDILPRNYEAHRGRALHHAIQRANLQRLTNASSNSAAFWKVYRSMVSPKPRPPAVALSELASCFEKRMNAPEPAPPAFNMERMRVIGERAANLPFPSGESPHPTLKGTVTEVDIAWAKEHLKSH